eukprot:350521-Chlamydomonas_euryale.AAC.4
MGGSDTNVVQGGLRKGLGVWEGSKGGARGTAERAGGVGRFERGCKGQQVSLPGGGSEMESGAYHQLVCDAPGATPVPCPSMHAHTEHAQECAAHPHIHTDGVHVHACPHRAHAGVRRAAPHPH